MQDVEDTARSVDGLNDLYDAIVGLLRPDGPPAIPTAVDYAYEMIWQQLLKGERTAGDRLADTDLAQQLGLSRTPVRQALHRLAHEEIVRFDARHGFSVRAFTPQDVHEIYDVRSALEVLALRLAAPRLKQHELHQQQTRLHDVRAALRERPDHNALVLHLQADFAFHNALIRAAGNGRLLRALAALRTQQALFQYRDLSFPAANVAAAEEHEGILLALIARDVAGATEQMKQHISNAKGRVLSDLFGDSEAAGEPESPASKTQG